MHLSPLAERLLTLLDGSAPDAIHWPAASQLTTALGRPGDSAVVDQTWRNMVVPARELADYPSGWRWRSGYPTGGYGRRSASTRR